MKVSIILVLLIGSLFINSAQGGFLKKVWKEVTRPVKQVTQIALAPVAAAVEILGGKPKQEIIYTTNVIHNNTDIDNTITNNTIININVPQSRPNSVQTVNTMNENEWIPRCVIAQNPVRQPLLSFKELMPMVDHTTQFTLDLYHAFNFTKKSIVFSPFYISRSLAMIHAGANGTTVNQMESALRFGIDRSILNNAYQQYLERLEPEILRDNNTLSIVNSLWSTAGPKFLQPFLDILGYNYKTCIRQIDFENEAEKSRALINELVSNETNHAIKECLPHKSNNYFASLVLVTAVSFKGNFASPFDKNATKNGTFTLLNGSSIETPMMQRTGWYSCRSHDDYEAITLPYKGEQLFITFVVPRQDKFDTIAATLSYDKITDLMSKRDHRYVSLALPKFEVLSTLSLEDVLQQLGLTYLFTDEADLSGMTGKPNLKLSDVFHCAFVSVEDEAGTASDPSTSVGGSVGGGEAPKNGSEPLRMEVNRPFMWIIHDRNDMILLMGHHIQP